MDFTLIARRETDNFGANNLAPFCGRNSVFVRILGLENKKQTAAWPDIRLRRLQEANARHAQLHISEQAFHC